MKKAKKFISIVLAVGLMSGLVPGKVLAAEYIDSADYNIERHDFSWSENGKLKLLYYYDQVVMDGNSANVEALNNALQQY